MSQVSELCDIDEDEYAPYPPAFSPAAVRFQSQTLPLNLHDTFDLTGLEDTIYYDAQSLPILREEPHRADPSPSCSVCGAHKGSLAILAPCTHPLCSGCLTSALNIVGEKDMECAVCKAKVIDFKLQKMGDVSPVQSDNMDLDSNPSDQSFGLLPSVLDGGFDDFIDRAQGASTPVARAFPAAKNSKIDDNVVLRIDNVPWVRRSTCRYPSVLLMNLLLRISLPRPLQRG